MRSSSNWTASGGACGAPECTASIVVAVAASESRVCKLKSVGSVLMDIELHGTLAVSVTPVERASTRTALDCSCSGPPPPLVLPFLLLFTVAPNEPDPPDAPPPPPVAALRLMPIIPPSQYIRFPSDSAGVPEIGHSNKSLIIMIDWVLIAGIGKH